MNPDHAPLRTFVEARRQSGVTDVTIYQELIAAGWPEATIQQFLSPAPQPFNPATPQSAIMSPYPSNATTATPTTGFFRGRLGRLGFLLAIVYVVIYCMIAVIISALSHYSSIINILVILMGIAGVLAVLPITISTHIRRWHDLNQSGWFTLLNFVPLVGFVAAILLFVLPGTSGPNKYDLAHPKSLSPKVIFGLSK